LFHFHHIENKKIAYSMKLVFPRCKVGISLSGILNDGLDSGLTLLESSENMPLLDCINSDTDEPCDGTLGKNDKEFFVC
jgi:hypothetical protein